MKKILVILMSLAMVVGLVGCGNNETIDNTSVHEEVYDSVNNNADVKSNDFVVALDEGTFIEAIIRYEEKGVNISNIKLFERDFTLPITLENIMTPFNWNNSDDDRSELSLSQYLETDITFAGSEYEDLDCYIDGDNTYDMLRLLSPYEKGTDFTFKECYENNYWEYLEYYSYQLEDCLGFPRGSIMWESEALFEAFGTPDSIILEGENLQEYLNTTGVYGANIGLVYDLDGCKLILHYVEVSHNDGSYGGEQFSGFSIVSNEAYEDCRDYYLFGNRIELWNREEGYKF